MPTYEPIKGEEKHKSTKNKEKQDAKQHKEKNVNHKPIPFIEIVIVAIVFTSISVFNEWRQNKQRQEAVDTVKIKETLYPLVGEDDVFRYNKVQIILMSKMTDEERDSFMYLMKKFDNNNITVQGMLDMQNILDTVRKRLSKEQKTIVNSFFSDSREKYGEKIIETFNR
jgi:hypothetical protein